MMDYDAVVSHPSDPYLHTFRPEGAKCIKMGQRPIAQRSPACPKALKGRHKQGSGHSQMNAEKSSW